SVKHQGLVTTSTDKGKSTAEDSESSSDSGPPEERPAVAYTKRKNGPDLEKLDALYMPDILAMRSWSEDEYEEYDDYLIVKWEINGFDKNDKVISEASSLGSPLQLGGSIVSNFQHVAADLFHLFSKGRPDLKNMHNWSGEDYDSYDLFLINKWKVSGFEEKYAAYVGIRDPALWFSRPPRHTRRLHLTKVLSTHLADNFSFIKKKKDICFTSSECCLLFFLLCLPNFLDVQESPC
ncbi:hypothetical protein IGI04_010706, partial [Brassica rapa subsp. trilocularis]